MLYQKEILKILHSERVRLMWSWVQGMIMLPLARLNFSVYFSIESTLTKSIRHSKSVCGLIYLLGPITSIKVQLLRSRVYLNQLLLQSVAYHKGWGLLAVFFFFNNLEKFEQIPYLINNWISSEVMKILQIDFKSKIS